MTYYKLYEEAISKLNRNEITLDEFDAMIKPLHDEVRPTGHWIVDRSLLPFTYTCDICGRNVFDDYDYCPNCGTRMVEPQEEGE